jgi:hypothetical protein
MIRVRPNSATYQMARGRVTTRAARLAAVTVTVNLSEIELSLGFEDPATARRYPNSPRRACSSSSSESNASGFTQRTGSSRNHVR